MAAAEHHLGFPVEVAQQLPLPAVPDAGADGADIDDGQGEQKPQALHRLHGRRQRLRRLRVGEVAPLRHVRHDEVLLDEPDDAIGVGRRQAEPRRELPRHLAPASEWSSFATLGDVMQERGEIERFAMRDRRQDLADQRQTSLSRPCPASLSTPTVRIRCSSTV